MTPFAALQALCGLSNREAADFLGTSENNVNKLRSGARGARAGRDYLTRLQELWTEIDQAAVDAAEALEGAGVLSAAHEIQIGYPADDHEARQLGLPCVGAWRQMAARVIDELMMVDDDFDPARITFVPRGSTLATAAAVDELEAAARKIGRKA